MVKKIEIQMFGGLSVCADGRQIKELPDTIDAPWKAFCILALHRQAFTTAKELQAKVLCDDIDANIEDAIKLLNKRFSCEDIVQTTENGYLLCDAIVWQMDIEQFETVLAQAQTAAGEECANLRQRAVELYHGSFLSPLTGEVWLADKRIKYEQLYRKNILELCEYHWDSDNFNEVFLLASGALQRDSLAQEHHLWLFRSLEALQMHRAMIPAYVSFERAFSSAAPTSAGASAEMAAEIEKIYLRALESLAPSERDILILSADLREQAPAENASGPLVCSYEVFKYLYHLAARASERRGGGVAVLLLTLDDGEAKSDNLLADMALLQDSVLCTVLRKSDTVARYSHNQCVVMLSVDTSANARYAVGRIRAQAQAVLGQRADDLHFATTAANIDVKEQQ